MPAVKSQRPRKIESRSRPRWLLAIAIVATICAGFLVGAPGVATPAHAATHGHYLNIGGFIAGNYLSSDGRSYVYCIEPGANEPYGTQQEPRRMSTIPAYEGNLGNDSTQWNGTVWDTPVSGQTLREMNYVMWTYGRTTVAEEAATVQFAVWLLRRGPGTSPWLDHHIAWIRANGYGWLVTDAERMVAEAQTRAKPAPLPEPTPLLLENMQYAADEAGMAVANGSVRYAAHTTQLEIEGGHFVDAGADFPVPESQSGSVDWVATLHADGWQRHHEVEISAEWSREVVSWPDEVTVHPPDVTNQQYLGAGISPVTEIQQLDLAPVKGAFDSQFRPQLSTQVDDEFVPHGGTFTDVVTAGVGPHATPWASRTSSDGAIEYAPVVAEGVLYGPFAHAPSTADEVPKHAPVAARTTLLLDEGPGGYRVSADMTADEAGYYSWVWSIREDNQQKHIQEAELLPEGYVFSDQFGTPSEGQTVPTRLRWSTDLVKREIGLNDMELIDRVTPTLHDGVWLRNESGDRIPAQLRLTVYQTHDKPNRQSEVPTNAVEVGRSSVELTTPGNTVTSDPIPIPWETRGWLTVQTCLLSEDQPAEAQGHFEEWCDDFGVEAETAEILLPQVRTEAQPKATPGETIRDTAYVTGDVPKQSTLGFRFYLQPEVGEPKFNENWKRMRDETGKVLRWTAEELGKLSAEDRCLAQPVAQTERIPVSGEGEYDSPEVRAESIGVGYWVEDLSTMHPDTNEQVELHRGACGLANERTVIASTETTAPQVRALADTGESGQGALIAVAALCALIGSGAVVLTIQRAKRDRERRSRN